MLLRCGFYGAVVGAVEIKMKENSVDIASWHLTFTSWIYIELLIFIYTDIYVFHYVRVLENRRYIRGYKKSCALRVWVNISKATFIGGIVTRR